MFFLIIKKFKGHSTFLINTSAHPIISLLLRQNENRKEKLKKIMDLTIFLGFFFEDLAI
jgi:hypothetical protein